MPHIQACRVRKVLLNWSLCGPNRKHPNAFLSQPAIPVAMEVTSGYLPNILISLSSKSYSSPAIMALEACHVWSLGFSSFPVPPFVSLFSSFSLPLFFSFSLALNKMKSGVMAGHRALPSGWEQGKDSCYFISIQDFTGDFNQKYKRRK